MIVERNTKNSLTQADDAERQHPENLHAVNEYPSEVITTRAASQLWAHAYQVKSDIKHPADRVVANARNIPHRTRPRTVRQFFSDSNRNITAPAGANKEIQMPFEQKLGSSALFDNDRDDKKSDLGGSVTIACPHCGATSSWWLNAWRRTSQKGLNYIALQLKPKRAASG